VPRLRTVAGSVMVQSLRIQRDTITSVLAGSGISSSSSSGGGGSGGPERRLSSGVDQAVRQFISQLSHNQKVWQGTLPDDVYYRSIGSLLNAGLEQVIQKILGLTDISAEMSGQFCTLFNQIVTKSPDLFKPDTSPDKYVRKWGKFREMITVLDSSLRVLEDRWAEGAGPLAKEFSADEVKQMIRAIFQNTERRAAVLSKIK
jgi:centromere/kinetochore protein ZW10